MPRFIIGLIAGILFIAILSVIANATNVGEVFLASVPDNVSLQASNSYMQQRLAMIEELNKYRARYGRQPLQVHPFLMQSAQWWAETEAKEARSGHPGVVNDNVLGRYPSVTRRAFCNSNQNSAAAIARLFSPREQIYKWAQSPGHNENQLNPRFKWVGAGIAFGRCNPGEVSDTSSGCIYPVVDFAG